jgi:hypothetical protein
MRSFRLGLVVGGILLACSAPKRDFQAGPGEGGAGAGGTGEGGAKASHAGDGGAAGDGGEAGAASCAADEYDDGASCNELTICIAGEFEQSPPTSDSDRTCNPCTAGTFSSAVNAASCKAWTACSATQTQSKAGTATSDVLCVDKPVCETAKDRMCTTQCPCASAEGVCTASNQCVSGATCVAGSGKKVGRAGDTCLATHCNNDTLDSGETSVDCGGECGCRATFEIVSYKNIPSGATITGFPAAMSRDGKRLVGYIDRDRTTYPAVFAYDGTVTELESYGKGGALHATNSDGSVSVGVVSCTNPPSCTSYGSARWSGSAAPTALVANGVVRATSSSGIIYAGDHSDSGTGFFSNGTQWTYIPDLVSVVALTPDGKYVAGAHKNGVNGALWFAQTQAVTLIGASNWTSTTINAANGTDPVVVGYGYISSSGSPIGFRWKGGVITELGLLPGVGYTIPNGVSVDGATVVGITGTNAFQQSFIWTDSGKLRTIEDELKARGVEPAVDLALPNATFVSDDGKTIVGWLPSPQKLWRVVLQ